MGRQRGNGRNETRTRPGAAAVVVLSCVALLGSSWVAASGPAGAAGSGVTAIGPVLTIDETPTVTLQRDGGMSVPLPNGNALWVFGDTPISRFENGAWYLRGFVAGSTAAEGPYAKGQAPAAMLQVNIGRDLAATNAASPFVPAATNINLPDGSGRACTRTNGAVESGRWPTGAVLMPDMVNVLVTYLAICDATTGDYHMDGFGFLEYNWMTNTISAGPDDVFPPAVDGSSLSSIHAMSSPIVLGNQVTLFSKSGTSLYATTMAADRATLANPGSYRPRAIPGLAAPLWSSVSVQPSAHPTLQLLEQTDQDGGFAVLAASSPMGPWVAETSGVLPGCSGWTSGLRCGEYYGHPELSTSSQLVMSYYQPGFGPGVSGHPDSTLFHLALAAISLTPNPTPLTVLSSSLPRALAGEAYRTTLVAGGATANATWSISNGTLPPGLAVDPASGTISGTPTAAGIYGFTAVATDTATTRTDSASLWIIADPSTATAPGAPTAVRALSGVADAGTGSMTVRYVAGPDNGAAIAKYTARCTSTNGGATKQGVHAGPTPASITVDNVTTGKHYRCRVRATNARGTGQASAASAPVIVGAPAAPTKVHAGHAAAGRIRVKFTPGASNGSPIGSYTARCASSNGGVAGSKTGTSGAIVVTRLTTGSTYTCTVNAKNGRGAGPASSPSAAVVA